MNGMSIALALRSSSITFIPILPAADSRDSHFRQVSFVPPAKGCSDKHAFPTLCDPLACYVTGCGWKLGVQAWSSVSLRANNVRRVGTRVHARPLYSFTFWQFRTGVDAISIFD